MTSKEQAEQREALIFNKGKLNLLSKVLSELLYSSPIIDEDKVINSLNKSYQALIQAEELLEKKIKKLDSGSTK